MGERLRVHRTFEQAGTGPKRRRGPAGSASARATSSARRAATAAPARQSGPEHDLVVAARDDPEMRARLVDAFMPLIGSIARIYRNSPGVDRGELLQAGVLGLLRALARYDPSLGTPFWAYASWWVRQGMQQLVSEVARPIVLSDRALRQLARIRDEQHRHLRAEGRDPTLGELAVRTGIARRQVEQLIAAVRPSRALDEPVNGDGEPKGHSFGDLIADPRAQDAYERVPAHLAIERLPGMLRQLNDRERVIIRGRYGLGGPERTLGELAVVLGVSAERVRQLEQRALDKLRLAFAAPAA